MSETTEAECQSLKVGCTGNHNYNKHTHTHTPHINTHTHLLGTDGADLERCSGGIALAVHVPVVEHRGRHTLKQVEERLLWQARAPQKDGSTTHTMTENSKRTSSVRPSQSSSTPVASHGMVSEIKSKAAR